jgi:hypothetical protein
MTATQMTAAHSWVGRAGMRAGSTALLGTKCQKRELHARELHARELHTQCEQPCGLNIEAGGPAALNGAGAGWSSIACCGGDQASN